MRLLQDLSRWVSRLMNIHLGLGIAQHDSKYAPHNKKHVNSPTHCFKSYLRIPGCVYDQFEMC